MRFIIKLVVAAAVVWCGFWALGTYAIASAITGWVEDRRAEGWRADVVSAQSGFPLNVSTKVASVDLVNAVTGATLQMQGAQVNARTYWPGHVDVEFPETPILFGPAGQQTSFTAQQGEVQLRLRPGLSLEVGQAQMTSDEWVLGTSQGEILRGAGLALRANQTARGSARYDVSVTATALALGAALRQMLSLPDALPQTFDTFTATGAAVFDGPLDKGSLDGTPVQFTQIILDGAQIDWGSIALRAMGALDVDVRGVPTGKIELQAKDWRNLLDLAETTGLLPRNRRGQAELMFSLLAARAGSRDDLDLTLEFAGGGMSLSGLPLGAAPNLTLRPYLQ